VEPWISVFLFGDSLREQIFYLVGIANMRLKGASEKKEMCHLEFCYVSTIFFWMRDRELQACSRLVFLINTFFLKKDQLYVPCQ